MAETDISFHLPCDLRGPCVTEDDDRWAAATCVRRWRSWTRASATWSIELVDTVVDNGWSAGVVLADLGQVSSSPPSTTRSTPVT